MAFKPFLIICLQACIFQITFAQNAANFGPSLGINPGPGQIGPLNNGLGGPIGPNVLGGSIGPLTGLGPISPAGPGYGYNNLAGPGPISNGPAYGYGGPAGPVAGPYCNTGYGGSGNGDVAVAGELPVTGSTFVAGQVPVVGGVQFGGSLPASGIVTITGSCSCGSQYGY